MEKIVVSMDYQGDGKLINCLKVLFPEWAIDLQDMKRDRLKNLKIPMAIASPMMTILHHQWRDFE